MHRLRVAGDRLRGADRSQQPLLAADRCEAQLPAHGFVLSPVVPRVGVLELQQRVLVSVIGLRVPPATDTQRPDRGYRSIWGSRTLRP